MGQRRCLGEEWGSDLVVKLQFQRCLAMLQIIQAGSLKHIFTNSVAIYLKKYQKIKSKVLPRE